MSKRFIFIFKVSSKGKHFLHFRLSRRGWFANKGMSRKSELTISIFTLFSMHDSYATPMRFSCMHTRAQINFGLITLRQQCTHILTQSNSKSNTTPDTIFLITKNNCQKVVAMQLTRINVPRTNSYPHGEDYKKTNFRYFHKLEGTNSGFRL